MNICIVNMRNEKLTGDTSKSKRQTIMSRRTKVHFYFVAAACTEGATAFTLGA